jgi:hypothetical protein
MENENDNIFLIVNLILGIVGVFGFFLAVYQVMIDRHRYKIPLQMNLRETKYVGQSGDNHLVLLSITFVNPASAGKTVSHILGGAPNSEIFSPCPYQYQTDKNSIICQLPNSDKAAIIQKNELLWLPLDIPPHQSETKWYPALIKHKAVKLVHQQYQVHLHLIAKDVFENSLSEYNGTVELKTQMVY